MEAMILAAGLGTRLAPLTDRMPKALILVRGRPLLVHVMDRLVAAGATRLVVNTCHYGEQIAEYLAAHSPPGVEIALSHEPDGPYDTGGGLLAAAHLFRREGRGGGPIVLHAVDVLSKIPLEGLLAEHRAARQRLGERVLATLAVQDRPATRRLLFDDLGLMGWERRGAGGGAGSGAGGTQGVPTAPEESRRVREPVGAVRSLGFAGIHVVEPAMLDHAERTGVFPIREWYLDLAAQGFRIEPADVSVYRWLDVGTPERLRDAEDIKWY